MNSSEFLGKGFAFPLGVDPVTGRMKMAEYEEDIRQAIYIILMTRKGERVMRPEFGCDIHNYSFSGADGPALFGRTSVRMENGDTVRLHVQAEGQGLYVMTVPKSLGGSLSDISRSVQLFVAE